MRSRKACLRCGRPFTDWSLRAVRQRREAVYALRESGLTYAAIGTRYGISPERVHQIVKREEALSFCRRCRGGPWIGDIRRAHDALEGTQAPAPRMATTQED